MPGEAQPPVTQRLHPLTVLFTAVTIARGFVLPAVVTGISVARRNPGGAIAWSAVIGGSASLIGGAATYLAFRYHLAADSLVIDSGVLRKQHRVIPLASVQNVDIRETALQRALGVATLTVETAAGGREADATFMVLGRETAETLRRGILAQRTQFTPAATESIPAAETPPVDSGIVITKLAPRDLIIAGATANHAGLLVAALAGAFQFIDDLPFPEWASRQLGQLAFDEFSSAITIGLVMIAILLVSGWILSIAGSLVGYYDFILISREDKLYKSHGLLGRRRTTIPLARVQAIRVEESVLRRPFALAALRVTTAGAATQQEGGGAERVAPIARAAELPRVAAAIFPSLNYAQIALQPVHPKSRSRAFMQYALVLLALATATTAWRAQLAYIPLLLLPPAWLLAAWQYRHRGYATVPRHVVARNGAINQITWLVPTHKLQTLHLRESPFQRRHGLATVVLDTAGGGGHASVRDLARADATRLIDSLRR